MVRSAVAAGGLATVGTLPIFLLSAQAVLVGAELGTDVADLGLAASCFFGVAAVVSLTCGGLLERLTARTVTLAGAGLGAASSLGIALAARSLPVLVALLVVGGVANALLQATANVMLARTVPPRRRGTAYGIKQSAIPVAVIVGGLAVPTVGALLGWRATFAVAAGLCVGVAAVAFGRAGGPAATAVRSVRRDLPPRLPLVVSALATMLASGAAVSLGAFLPSWAHQTGLSTDEAALLLAGGGALSLVARLGSGLAADRRRGRHLPVVTVHLLVGAVAIVLLSFDERALLVVGSLVAFGVGWSWPGVLLFALVRVGRDSPGTASSAVQGGNFAGAAAGPALFGYLVATTDYPTAWRAAAAAMLLGGLLLVVARAMFLADRRHRPPARDLD